MSEEKERNRERKTGGGSNERITVRGWDVKIEGVVDRTRNGSGIKRKR